VGVILYYAHIIEFKNLKNNSYFKNIIDTFVFTENFSALDIIFGV